MIVLIPLALVAAAVVSVLTHRAPPWEPPPPGAARAWSDQFHAEQDALEGEWIDRVTP